MNNLGDPNGCVCMSMRIAFAVLRFIANSRFEAYSRALNPHSALFPVGLWERGPTKSAGKSPLATTARRDSCVTVHDGVEPPWWAPGAPVGPVGCLQRAVKREEEEDWGR